MTDTQNNAPTIRTKRGTYKEVVFFIVWLTRLIVDAIREKKAQKQQEKSDPA